MTIVEIIIIALLLTAGVLFASLFPLWFEYDYDAYVIEENFKHAMETIKNGTYSEEEQRKYEQEHPAYQAHSTILLR